MFFYFGTKGFHPSSRSSSIIIAHANISRVIYIQLLLFWLRIKKEIKTLQINQK